jgi:hypothetical protein
LEAFGAKEVHMPKVIYNSTKGLYQSAGTGISLEGNLVLTGSTTVSSTLNVAGSATLASTLNVAGSATLSGALIGSIDTRAEAGAVSLTALTTMVTTTAPRAISLAAGTNGQIKIITMTVDGGDATLTPANGLLGGATTITFNDVGDTVVLVYTSPKWAVVSNNGATIA